MQRWPKRGARASAAARSVISPSRSASGVTRPADERLMLLRDEFDPGMRATKRTRTSTYKYMRDNRLRADVTVTSDRVEHPRTVQFAARNTFVKQGSRH
jgi:hypothetical protein